MGRNANNAYRLVKSFATLLVVSAAGAQVLSRPVPVRTQPPVQVITVHLGGGIGQSPLTTVPTWDGTLGGTAGTPAITRRGSSTSSGGPSETPAQPVQPAELPVAELWLQRDSDWLDKNMLLWMDHHPVLLKQP